MTTPTMATKERIRQYLTQVAAGATNDAALNEIGLRADDIVNKELGFTFGTYGTAAEKPVLGYPSPYLFLPPHNAGSVELVKNSAGATITGWTEEDNGSLYVGAAYNSWYKDRYLVTAAWGPGPAPDALIEVAVEIAVNLWREKEKGSFSDVIGVEGGGAVAVGYQRAFTNRQKYVLGLIKRKYGKGLA